MSGGHKIFGDGAEIVAEDFGQLGSPLPRLAATAVTLVVFLCGAALVLGLFTRWVSMPLAISMVVDILLFHPPNGFFVDDDGYEYALLRLAASVALVLAGPGKAALDSILASRERPTLSRLLR